MAKRLCALTLAIALSTLPLAGYARSPKARYLKAYEWIYGRPMMFYDIRNGYTYMRYTSYGRWRYALVYEQPGVPKICTIWINKMRGR